MRSGIAAIRVKRPIAIKGGQMSSIIKPITADVCGSSHRTGYSYVASNKAVCQLAALTRPEAKKLCASQSRMKRSSSGPAECSAKCAMSTAVEITRAIDVATECFIHLERTGVVGGCIVSLAIGRLLQQQHVTVRIAHHGGVDA